VARLRARADLAEVTLARGIGAGVTGHGTPYPPSRIKRIEEAVALDREAADLIEVLGGVREVAG
jgi:hypothetical protein